MAGKSRWGQWLRYLALAVLPVLAGLWLLSRSPNGAVAVDTLLPAQSLIDALLSRLAEPLPRFLLQLMVVLGLAKAAGALMRRFGQPAVIGEMLAGIVLGPSLFGQFLPQAQAWLFPTASLGTIGNISQLGVLVFMFAAGAEVNLDRLRSQKGLTLLVSHAGIALPFLFGILLALPLYRGYAPAGVGFAGFAMFIGIALSVTAFPVLLRILEERGYSAHPIGTIAVACAAISDATAWTMLGLIVASVQAQSPLRILVNLLLIAVFVWIIVARVRPRLADSEVSEQREPQWMIGLVLLILACALLTEATGLHALFGAFLAGIVVSRSESVCRLVENKIVPFASVLLLPLFFASTGLRTRIDLLTGSEWLLCLAIVIVATLGKLGGTVVAARWWGMARADAWRLGALMNTRGLMELIVLGLGYELGLIDQRLYAILVLVAIVTTVMTGPLLSLIDRLAPAPQSDSSIRQ